MHVGLILYFFELLEVGYVLFGIFLGLWCDESYQVEVIRGQCHIEQSIRLDKPTNEF